MSEAITAHVVTVSLVSFPKKRKLKIVSISVEQQLMCLNCLHYFKIKKGGSQKKKVVEYFSNSISTYVLYNTNIG